MGERQLQENVFGKAGIWTDSGSVSSVGPGEKGMSLPGVFPDEMRDLKEVIWPQKA